MEGLLILLITISTMRMLLHVQLGVLTCYYCAWFSDAFVLGPAFPSLYASYYYTTYSSTRSQSVRLREQTNSNDNSGGASSTTTTADELARQAQDWLAQARALQEEIISATNDQSYLQKEQANVTTLIKQPPKASPWSVPVEPENETDNAEAVDYRLYVDIGREDGTWMDPRWGASGRRIEFTLDVRFLPNAVVVDDPKVIQAMVQDNWAGRTSRSQVCTLRSAPAARLRQGFDRMTCQDGAFRVDTSRNGARTVRFYVRVDGTTPTSGSSYDDIYVPSGNLYFSLPVFGSSGVSQLSSKEGPVTVRQIGWHTGWRRQESRIVGMFQAVPLHRARQKDGF